MYIHLRLRHTVALNIQLKIVKKFAIHCVFLTAAIVYKQNEPYKPKYS